MITIKSILDCKNSLGEGPIWCSITETLYWVDIKGKSIWKYCPSSGDCNSWQIPEEPGSMVQRANNNGFILAAQNGFRFFDPDAQVYEIIENYEQDLPHSRFNDGRCDRQGRFWVGTMDDLHKEPIGSLYRLDSNLQTSIQDKGIIISNSIAFSPDGCTLYYCDTIQKEIWAYDIDVQSGNASNKRVFTSTKHLKGGPDGSAVDRDGYLWNAMWGGGCLVRWAPDGTFDRKIELPIPNPTCPVFGGTNLDTIYVTSARVELDEYQLIKYPDSGNLFSIYWPGGTLSLFSFFPKKPLVTNL